MNLWLDSLLQGAMNLWARLASNPMHLVAAGLLIVLGLFLLAVLSNLSALL